MKKWKERNQEKVKQYSQKYWVKNKSKITPKKRVYNKINKEKISETSKKYFIKNKDKIMDAQKKWRKANSDKIKKYVSTYNNKYPEKIQIKNFRTKVSFLKKLDLSFDEFKILLEKQNYLCDICKKPETLKHQSGKPRLLCIDHCHKSNKVRGLLCQKCNSGLGFFKDELSTVFSAYNYLKKHGK